MTEYLLYGIVIAMFFAIIGLIKARGFFEKMLFANIFSNHIILFIVIFAYFSNNEYFIDIAIIYAILGFITNIAIAKRSKN